MHALERIDFAFAHQPVRDGDAAVRDFPLPCLLVENEYESCGLPGEIVVFNRQLDREEACGNGDVFGQRLDRQVLDLNAQCPFDLRKILPRDGDPFLPVFHQIVGAAGKSRKVRTEMVGKKVISR